MYVIYSTTTITIKITPCTLSALMLPTLVEEGLISEHTFYHIPDTTSDLQASQQVLPTHSLLINEHKFSCYSHEL